MVVVVIWVGHISYLVDKGFSGGQKRSNQVYVGKGIYPKYAMGTGSSSVFQSTLLNVTMLASFLDVT